MTDQNPIRVIVNTLVLKLRAEQQAELAKLLFYEQAIRGGATALECDAGWRALLESAEREHAKERRQ